MGMFDHVDCRMELPDGYVLDHTNDPYGENVFQSKDFDCIMASVVIHENGVVTQNGYPVFPDDDFYFYGGNRDEWRMYLATVEHGTVGAITLVRNEFYG